MKEIKNYLWGIVLIGIGVILGLNALDIVSIDIFFDGWWTLFIIIPCFIGLFSEESKTGNLIGLVIGIVLLLCCQGLLEFDMIWKLAFPTILVIIGLSMIFKNMWQTKLNQEIKKISQKNNKENECCATFSSQDISFDEEEFKGADLTAVFGGVSYDLRNAIIKEDQVINCSAIFGGIDIFVPKGVEVKVKSNSIFGGVSNKAKNTNNEKEHILYINATCMFGAVEIK